MGGEQTSASLRHWQKSRIKARTGRAAPQRTCTDMLLLAGSWDVLEERGRERAKNRFLPEKTTGLVLYINVLIFEKY